MNQDTEVPKNIIEKLEKLMALEERGGTMEESINASTRIQEILRKYNLDRSDINANKEDAGATKFSGVFNDLFKKNEGDFYVVLLNNIAEINGLVLIAVRKEGLAINLGGYRIYGKKHQIEICLFFTDQLATKIRILENRAWNEYRGDTKRGQYRRSFYKGASNAILSKLRQAAEISENKTPEYGLMRVSDLDQARAICKLDLAGEDRLKSGKQSKAGSQDGFHTGIQAGSRMDLNKGVGNNPSSSRLLN